MKVLVTGANGHLGLLLTKELAARGHKVRASVRSKNVAAKTAALQGVPGVEIVEAELFNPAQLRAALEGIELFFHVAATYSYVVEPGREEELVVRPSVVGAENAMRAAADAGVRKVVLTSSLVTVPLTPRGAPPSTEADWTTDYRVAYLRAKAEGEKRAWSLARELGVNLVTVLPGGICGPGFSRNTPSTDLIEAIMLGYFRAGIPNANFPYVDGRDVVSAHVLAGEKDCAGRFIVCNDHLPTLSELNTKMHEIDPSIPLPLMQLPDFMMAAAPLFDRLNHRLLKTPRLLTPEFIAATKQKVWNASNARVRRELGWRQSIPLKVSLRDTMAQIRENRSRRAA